MAKLRKKLLALTALLMLVGYYGVVGLQLFEWPLIPDGLQKKASHLAAPWLDQQWRLFAPVAPPEDRILMYQYRTDRGEWSDLQAPSERYRPVHEKWRVGVATRKYRLWRFTAWRLGKDHRALMKKRGMEACSGNICRPYKRDRGYREAIVSSSGFRESWYLCLQHAKKTRNVKAPSRIRIAIRFRIPPEPERLWNGDARPREMDEKVILFPRPLSGEKGTDG